MLRHPLARCFRILTMLATIIYFVPRRETSNHILRPYNEGMQKTMKYTDSKNIVLVIVVCPPPNNYEIRDEATVLLKSIIISANLNKISTITIYFFLENMSRDKAYLMEKIYEFGYPFSNFILNIRFRSAVESVPQKYRNMFIKEAYHDELKRCTNVRMFVQSALPLEDAVLYLDTDIVVHGNLMELWNTWDLMDRKQIVGVATDYEEGSYLEKWYKNFIYPPPRYLNPGVLLMNLTRMRNFDWERKLLRIRSDNINRFRFTLNDQHLINMLLRIHTNVLYRLPCQYNYMYQHCTKNSPCKTAENSGLQIIHGVGSSFHSKAGFRNFYFVYRQLNMSSLNFYSNEVFRNFVQKSLNNSQNTEDACHGILSQIIK